MEMNIHEPVRDPDALTTYYYILRDGFEFRQSGYPHNVYDSLVVKEHPEEWCLSPRTPPNCHTLAEHIELINSMRLEKVMPIVESSLEFLTQCPSLKHVHICLPDSAVDGFDYSPLYSMPNIRYLRCITEYGERDEKHTTVDYSKMPWLEFVSVHNKRHLHFNTLPKLKSLHISRYKADNISDMFCSRQLDTLSMVRCSVTSLASIERSDKMQCLYLYDDRRLHDISALERVSGTLKSLAIENCGKIADFSVLENLEYLKLWGNNSIPSLGFIKKMKNLKTLSFSINVLDGDLTPCMDLSWAGCQNRRHYNFKHKDLPKGKFIYGNEDIETWRRLFGEPI